MCITPSLSTASTVVVGSYGGAGKMTLARAFYTKRKIKEGGFGPGQ